MKKKVVAVSSKEVKKRSIIKQYDIFFVLSLRQNRKKGDDNNYKKRQKRKWLVDKLIKQKMYKEDFYEQWKRPLNYVNKSLCEAGKHKDKI